jgi:hypothetical protein
MTEEFTCDYCGTGYSNEDSTLLCPECEVRWCSSCTLDTFCPHCSGAENVWTQDQESALTATNNMLRDCPVCLDETLVWEQVSVDVDFTVSPPNNVRIVETLCVVCGHCHETRTEKIGAI